MKPLEIKAEIIRKGLSLTDIANEAGSTVAEVSRCIYGEGLYQRIREVIAERLSKRAENIFNDRKHPRPKVKASRVL